MNRYTQFLSGCLIIFCFVNTAFGQPAQKSYHSRPSFSISVGNWQPHSLNDEPRFDSFGAAGATPFVSLSFLLPLRGGTNICLSTGFWALQDLDEVETVHSLTLLPISIDFKYILVPENRLTAYVQYGGGFYWGIENVSSPLENINEARTGIGVNLGAGFDLTLSHYLGFGVEFQYVYMVFDRPLGGVEDFSGPRITGLIHFIL
ncbi:hypothetical protein KAR48_20490 [bacterium]|nr:hypothetical protein [bacterium]